jgi:hypothetical protein
VRLAWIEIFAILSEAHQLASLERIPRDELVNHPILTLPRSVNPEVVDQIHEVLLEGREPLSLVEAMDMAATARIARAAEDPKLIGIGFGGEAELDAPGVVFRPFQEPTPRIEHGIAWFDTHASPFVDGFVGVARELIAEAPPSRTG